MKLKFIITAILLTTAISTFSQNYGEDYVGGWYDEEFVRAGNHEQGIGIQVLYGGGRNLMKDAPYPNAPNPNVPKVKSTWIWNDFLDIALVGFYPIGDKRKMGIQAEAGLKNMGYGSSKASQVHVNFIDLGAAYVYKGIFAGVCYGVNIGGHSTDPNEIEDDLSADVFNNLLSLKAGYQVQLGKRKVSSKGRFNLVAQIEYPLAGMMREPQVWTDPNNDRRHRRYNYQPFEVKIGFNYFFDYRKSINEF